LVCILRVAAAVGSGRHCHPGETARVCHEGRRISRRQWGEGVDMRRLFVIVAALALMLVAVPLTPAGATPPLEVAFEVPTSIPPEGGPSSGPFVATGPAVSDGIMCETGQTIDVFGKASGFQSNRGVNFQVVKLFTCDDGSGEFFVKLQVRIDQKGDNFNWTVVGGTGAYADLHGTGGGIGIPLPDNAVLDLYDGQVHVD
jgi:hypothetical protein